MLFIAHIKEHDFHVLSDPDSSNRRQVLYLGVGECCTLERAEDQCERSVNSQQS